MTLRVPKTQSHICEIEYESNVFHSSIILEEEPYPTEVKPARDPAGFGILHLEISHWKQHQSFTDVQQPEMLGEFPEDEDA